MMAPSSSSLTHWVASSLDRVGLLRALSLAAGYVKRSFPVLSYHRVNDDGDVFFPAMPTTVFEEQMAFVARTYVVFTIEELVERMGRDEVPANALAITFDDGYRDNFTHAAPILARYGLPATVFLASGFIGTSEVPWFDRVALMFKKTSATSYWAPWGERVALESPGARVTALWGVVAYLKTLPDDQMRGVVTELRETLELAGEESFKGWMLTWDDVQALLGLGITVGAHTVSHPILSRLSPDRAWSEIDGSRAMITAGCGASPRAFAYPNGRADDYTREVVQMVRDAGFICALTTRFGVNTATTPPYELKRGTPWEHHVPTFGLKLAGYRFTEA
jgi:peptidoglycan/xylan/chitin deacetylase (PgdA/CDA1 family)